jgi:hypothetical protein
MTGNPQRHAVPRGSDNPQDLVRVGLRVARHQRVPEHEPRHLSPLSQRIPDSRGIRRARPPRSGSHEQRARAATATDIRRAPHRRPASRHASLHTAAGNFRRALRRGTGTSRHRRYMPRSAGRDQDGARHDYQAGNPGHVMTIKPPRAASGRYLPLPPRATRTGKCTPMPDRAKYPLNGPDRLRSPQRNFHRTST